VIDGPPDTIKLLASQWDEAKWTHCCCCVPQARALNHRGMGDFHMDAPDAFAVASAACRAISSSPGSNGFEAALRDAPDGPFSTNILWDRGDRGRARIRRRPRPVV